MLAEARTRIRRYTPEEAAADEDLLIVDLRSVDERERTGVIPGSKHVPVDLGVDAGDLIGGYDAW